MRRAEEYIVSALKAAQTCTSIQQAVDAGSEFGKIVAGQVIAYEKRVHQKNDTNRIGLEDAFQHALNLAVPQSIVQAFLDAALGTLTDKLRGQAR